MIDWQAFKRGEFAVRCDTKDKARAFLTECRKRGLLWADDDQIKPNKTYWRKYKENTCYYCSSDGLKYGHSFKIEQETPIFDYGLFVGINKLVTAPETDVQMPNHIADSAKNAPLFIDPNAPITVTPDQTVKHDAGKPQLTIVPTSLVRATAAVLEFGADNYERDGWRKVDKQRFRDALYRHWLAYLDDPDGVDKESELPHIWHVVANAAFLIEMETKK